MKITQEQFNEIKKALTFYANQENFEWDGCRCHGHYNLLDHGETARDALDTLNLIEEIPCSICKHMIARGDDKCPECGEWNV
jgi:hypothetical protein